LTPSTTAKAQLLPWVLGGIVAMVLAASAAGLWAGNRWAAGQHALEQNRELRTLTAQLASQIEQLHAAAADSVLAYDQATQRLDLVATQQEQDREANRRHNQALQARLEQLLDARPDLRQLRLGDDVLRHWNDGNAGPAAAPAAAGDRSKPAPAVSGPSAGAGRPRLDAAGQPRPGDRPVPRLPPQPGQPGHGSAGVGGHGLGLVLQGSQAAGSEG